MLTCEEDHTQRKLTWTEIRLGSVINSLLEMHTVPLEMEFPEGQCAGAWTLEAEGVGVGCGADIKYLTTIKTGLGHSQSDGRHVGRAKSSVLGCGKTEGGLERCQVGQGSGKGELEVEDWRVWEVVIY